jgi:very-short-patch-repair endonuclease
MNGNDAWRAVAELAASQHGAFNRNQAAPHQLNARQLRAAALAGQLRRPLSDVYVFASHPKTFRQRCMVASLAGAVVSHSSAATLHDFDGFGESGGPIDVCFERTRARKLTDTRLHTWTNTDANDVTTVDGIRCTSKARTLFQLGAVCTRDQVEVALDSALRQGAAPAWIEQTAHRLRRPGPTGGGVLFDLMSDPSRAGALSESVFEHLVEHLLSIPGLPPVVRQHPVVTTDGTKRLDLAFPDVMLGIECHSRRHHSGPSRGRADTHRDVHLAAVGWEIIYVSWELAHNPAELIPLVRSTYEHRSRLLRGTG